MISFLRHSLDWLQPVLIPICFLVAWSTIAIAVSSFLSLARESSLRIRKLHQIPCANCQFFTDDYRLKCTIHPQEALSERAIDCPDFTGRSRF